MYRTCAEQRAPQRSNIFTLLFLTSSLLFLISLNFSSQLSTYPRPSIKVHPFISLHLDSVLSLYKSPQIDLIPTMLRSLFVRKATQWRECRQELLHYCSQNVLFLGFTPKERKVGILGTNVHALFNLDVF